MRSRNTIEESFKTIVVPMGSDHIKVELELLLDIRELLLNINNRELEEEVTKARKEMEEKRMSML